MSARFGLASFFAVCALTATSFAQRGFAQNLIVTVSGHDGSAPPELVGDDISVEVDHHPASVCEWTPLKGDHAALQLYIAIDDGTSTDLTLQYKELKEFIAAQPPSTEIGLAYLRNGMAVIASPLTSDHAKVASALRIPAGPPGISASPYMGISDLIKKWPETDVRREILFIGSGIDPYAPHDPQNIYLGKAIDDAQRAGIPVNSIYYSETGRLGHNYWDATWGQNFLSEIGEATGGKAYWEGNINPVSLAPYLNDFAMRLANQYLLTVDLTPAKTGLKPVHVTTPRAGISIAAASKIYLRR